MLFAAMCLLVVPFAHFSAQNLQAANAIEFIHSIKLEYLFIPPIYVCFAWFIALYTGNRPKPFLAGITLAGLIVFLANLYQPYSLQYDRFEGIRTLQLPWGEAVSRGIGQPGPLMFFATATFFLVIGFVLYSLGSAYRREHRRTDLWMLLAFLLFVFSAIEGALARLSVIDFIELGPFGFLVVVIVMSVSLTRETQHRLRTSEQNFRSLFENSPVGMVAIDPQNGRILQVNHIALKMIGYSAEEILTKTVADVTPPEDMADSKQRYEQLAKGLVDHLYYERRYIRKDGSSFLGYSSISILKDDKGNISRFIGSTIDITERKKIEESLFESEKRFRTVIEQSPIGISFNRDGYTVDGNAVYLQMFGYDDISELRGSSVLNRIAPQCRVEVEDRIRRRILGAQTETTYETVGLRKDGSQFPLLISAKRMELNDGPMTCVFLIDNSDRKASEEKIQKLAFYDHLTNLPNRLLLLDRLKQGMASSVRSGRKGSLLLIDLDNFKNLNNTLGHDIGDLLLQQVTQRLESCIRESDTVARLGGDEFVVMLLELNEQSIEAAAQTEAIGEKILVTLNQPCHLGPNIYRCTASIGATLFQDHQQSTDELMTQADIAMYQAKKAGRNTLRFFDPQMQASIMARVSLEVDLREAIERQQFRLHYQIQVDRTRRPFGVESLIRWIHPERGIIFPAEFIPLAEETGLILPIGVWVMETACAQIKAWEQDARTRELVLSVNVSANQFHQADFVAQVQAVVHRHAINPKLLKLELTEGILITDINEAIATMNALNNIGVRFSLDDFGTGYSSLQYLKQLPLDQLKIDQSFVRDIAIDNSDKAIVSTIISMAQILGLDVIAEGVETEEQQQLLIDSGCSNFQGYLFGRPVPIEQCETLLKQG
jgi:diguanylate cyclase (GGDEF)-like protein/PAS domain S-box-containing protein